MPTVAANVRYWGQSGHAILHCICLLMTQSGHGSGFVKSIRVGNKPGSPESRAKCGRNVTIETSVRPSRSSARVGEPCARALVDAPGGSRRHAGNAAAVSGLAIAWIAADCWRARGGGRGSKMRTRCLRRAPHHRIAGLFPKKHETDDDRAGVARERPGAGRVGWIFLYRHLASVSQ